LVVWPEFSSAMPSMRGEMKILEDQGGRREGGEKQGMGIRMIYTSKEVARGYNKLVANKRGDFGKVRAFRKGGRRSIDCA